MHKSVLLKEVIDALAVKPDGIYVDATFGRGGHSREILARLGDSGRLIVFDQDPEAIQYAKAHFNDPRVMIVAQNFESLKENIKHMVTPLTGKAEVDGMLFDLGVSSPQLDEAARGFSFLKDGPLDMRMDTNSGKSCAEVLRDIDEKELSLIIKNYGEEKFARQIARAIVATPTPLTTTLELANLIENTIPRRFHEKHKHPATRTFQALRIYVNRELEVLETALNDFADLLCINGRAVFLSFHSLEDRLVKQKIQSLVTIESTARRLPIQTKDEDLPRFKLYIKMQKAEAEELENNPRARSATLRVVERIR